MAEYYGNPAYIVKHEIRGSRIKTMAAEDARLLLRSDHVGRVDQEIEFLRRHEPALDRFLLERGAFLVRALGDLGGGVVADLGRQRGDEHERALQPSLDVVAPGLD